ELDVEQSLAVGTPCLGLSALERAESLLHRALTCRAVALELEPELRDGRQLALIEGHLPVAAEAGHLTQERLEEVWVEVSPRARHLLVESAPERREPAERQPARAGLREPPRHIARAVADQRHDAPVGRREDDLAVAFRVGVGDLHVEVELVHVITAAMGALERED